MTKACMTAPIMKTRSNIVAESIPPVLKRKTIKTAASKNTRKELTTECHRHVTELEEQKSRIATPKLKRRKDIKSQTPGREDILFSQHFDSQTVVGWDCNSPASVRNLAERKHGDENDGVEDLVSRLIGDEEEDNVVPSRNTPPLLGLWRDKSKSDGDGLIPSHRRQRKHTGKKKKKNLLLSHELLERLNSALKSCSDVEKETEGRNAEGELYLPEITELDEPDETMESGVAQNVSNDLFESFKDEPPTACDALADITWSDDELFGNDSFIVHATQVPSKGTQKFPSPVIGGKRKSNSKEFPKSKCTRYSAEGSLVNKQTGSPESMSKSYTALINKQSSESSHQKQGISDLRQSSNVSKPPLSSNTCTVTSSSSCTSTGVLSRSKQSTDFNKNVITKSSSTSLSFQGSNKGGVTYKDVAASRGYGSTGVNDSSYNQRSTDSLNRSGSFKKYNSFSGPRSQTGTLPLHRQRSLSGSHPNNSNANVFQTKKYSENQTISRNTGFKESNLKVSTFLNRQSDLSSNQNSQKGSFSNNFSNTVKKQCSNKHVGNTQQNVQNVSVTSDSSYQRSCVNSVTVNSFASIQTGKNHTCSNKTNKSSTNIANSLGQGSKISAETCQVSTSKLLLEDFDTSLSDDLLDQLAESDDALEDQIEIAGSSISKAVSTGDSICLNTKDGFTSSNIGQHSRPAGVPKTEGSTRKKFTFKPSQKPGIHNKSSNCQRKPQNKIIDGGTTGKSDTVNKVEDSAVESDKTGNKTTATNMKNLPYSEDLFSDDDDLLTDGDGLTEAQIFAMLDEVEMMATQKRNRNSQSLHQSNGNQSHVTAERGKLIDGNINKSDKRQETNKLGHHNVPSASESLCATKHDTNNQDNLMGSQDQESSQGTISSQGQVTSSQCQMTISQAAKCSAAEIERKKRLALERRQRRLKESQILKS